MEAGTRICSHCGLRRLTEAECPACGSPTYMPYDPASAEPPDAAQGAPSPALGVIVTLLGAGVLLGSLFMPWYAIDLPGGLRQLLESAAQQFGAGPLSDLEATAWEAFEIADIALAAAAGLAAAIALAALTGRVKPAEALRVLTYTGGFVIGVTIYRVVDQPDPAQLLGVQSGPWVALAAGVAIVVGAALTTARSR